MKQGYTLIYNTVIRDANLTGDEKSLFIGLLSYYNNKFGYSYPGYEQLLDCVGTKRREKISKLIKKLVEKGYIKVKKMGRKSIYFILKAYDGICLVSYNEKSNVAPVEVEPVEEEIKEEVEEIIPEEKEEVVLVEKNIDLGVDSNGNNPIDGQLHIEHYEEIPSFINTKQSKIDLINNNIKNLTTEQQEQLMGYSYNQIKSVLDRTTFANFNYVIKGLEMDQQNKKGFNNFEGRDYDFDEMEKYLLGWA